jgi:dihydrofolate synthase / folylpolyglutamate synthase
MRALLAALGDPHLAVPVMHVAGTNGKGSTVATLEAILRAKGRRVAKYTSPHLVDFRERIIVDGRPIAPETVTEFVARWTPEAERLGATFFEVTTALAFEHFARANVDVALIETGLGGRLDATNVVAPIVAGVTAIGLDHTEFLGHTLEQIAAEKGGIYKPDAPAVVGEPNPGLRRTLADQATSVGARPVRVVAEECRIADIAVAPGGTSFTIAAPWGAGRLQTTLVGRFQAANTATALTMLDAAGDTYATDVAEAAPALRAVRIPGRYQRVGPFIFDVAHNPDGAAVLAETLLAMGAARPIVALVTVLADKDWRGMLGALAPVVDRFVLSCAPTAPASRAWRVEDAHEYVRDRGWPVEVERDFDAALARAEALGATVVVTGSFHTVGDAMARLQVDPLAG